MKTAITCTALMGLLLFALGLYVSTKRGRTQQIGTTPQNPADPLFKAIRAHGNTAEYAPMLAILMLYLGTQSPGAWILWTMVVVTVCRYLIVVGSSCRRLGPAASAALHRRARDLPWRSRALDRRIDGRLSDSHPQYFPCVIERDLLAPSTDRRSNYPLVNGKLC